MIADEKYPAAAKELANALKDTDKMGWLRKITEEFASSGSASSSDISRLFRDLYFLFEHGLTFEEYITLYPKN